MSWMRKSLKKYEEQKYANTSLKQVVDQMAEQQKYANMSLQQQYDDLKQRYGQQYTTTTSSMKPVQAPVVELSNRLAKSQNETRDIQLKLQSLQRAVSSIVLRLKVLDVEQLEKDMKEDGTIPLRVALSELKALVAAYDGMPKENMPDYGLSTTAPYYGSPSASASAYPGQISSWTSTTRTY